MHNKLEGKLVRGERKQILDLFIIEKFRGIRGYVCFRFSFGLLIGTTGIYPWLGAFAITFCIFFYFIINKTISLCKIEFVPVKVLSQRIGITFHRNKNEPKSQLSNWFL